jgi:hypothetical protein
MRERYARLSRLRAGRNSDEAQPGSTEDRNPGEAPEALDSAFPNEYPIAGGLPLFAPTPPCRQRSRKGFGNGSAAVIVWADQHHGQFARIGDIGGLGWGAILLPLRPKRVVGQIGSCFQKPGASCTTSRLTGHLRQTIWPTCGAN